jgi:hypothetical protein
MELEKIPIHLRPPSIFSFFVFLSCILEYFSSAESLLRPTTSNFTNTFEVQTQQERIVIELDYSEQHIRYWEILCHNTHSTTLWAQDQSFLLGSSNPIPALSIHLGSQSNATFTPDCKDGFFQPWNISHQCQQNIIAFASTPQPSTGHFPSFTFSVTNSTTTYYHFTTFLYGSGQWSNRFLNCLLRLISFHNRNTSVSMYPAESSLNSSV